LMRAHVRVTGRRATGDHAAEAVARRADAGIPGCVSHAGHVLPRRPAVEGSLVLVGFLHEDAAFDTAIYDHVAIPAECAGTAAGMRNGGAGSPGVGNGVIFFNR